MKQNKKFLAIILVIIVLVSFVSISAFAVDITVNNIEFSSQPYSANSTFNFNVINGTTSSIVNDSSLEDIYIFQVAESVSSNSAKFFLVSTSQFSNISFHVVNGSYSYYSSFANSITVDSTQYFYNTNESNPGGLNGLFTTIPIIYRNGSTVDEALEYAINLIYNSSSSSSYPLNISLPAGNAIYIDVHGLNPSATITTTTPQQYHASPFSSNQLISYTDSISTSGSISGSPIEWTGIGKTDLFGRYSSWTRSLIVNPTKTYICIVNPYYNSEYVDVEHYDANSAINISVSSAYSYKFVSLNSNVSSGTIETTNSDDTFSGEYDPNTDTWSTTDDSTGLPGSPSQGGNIIPQTANSINDWLENIAKQIGNFFSGAIGAVSTLVAAGRDFFGVLIGLYSWLPPAVFSVLSSALIVVITIGVIKVFI